MIQVTGNVFVENEFVACNLGLITTEEGVVLIDVPIRPTDAVKWRDETSKRGELRYVINTEEHADHCQNSCFFSGVLVTSQITRGKMVNMTSDEITDRTMRLDPEGLSLMKSFKLRLADITISENMNIYLGGLTFNLFPLPGHSTGGIGVYLPEQKILFATDCIFHHVKTWMPEADPDRWLESLKKLEKLDIDVIVPGHGSICNKDYIKEQTGIIRQWMEVIQTAIKQGFSIEEAIDRISPPDPYPKQPNTPLTEDELNRKIITRLYNHYLK
ncbi:MBL fold metallo-hydrolase [Chloroflexota bacterium]